eukprot:4280377-Pleurochrysis_carterae.AAC.1
MSWRVRSLSSSSSEVFATSSAASWCASAPSAQRMGEGQVETQARMKMRVGVRNEVWVRLRVRLRVMFCCGMG